MKYSSNSESPQVEMAPPEYDGIRVKLCEDGCYRWTYPLNMFKNPNIYLSVCKVFGAIGAVAFVIAYIGPVLQGNFAIIGRDIKYWGIGVLVFLVLSCLAYLMVAGMYKGKYIVRFAMTEEGLAHEQLPAQAKKAQDLGGATAVAGALTGNLGRAGQGILIASHTSLSTDFSKVKRIKAMRRWNTIKVRQLVSTNQVYTTAEDFDFVLDYIREHCPKAK